MGPTDDADIPQGVLQRGMDQLKVTIIAFAVALSVAACSSGTTQPGAVIGATDAATGNPTPDGGAEDGSPGTDAAVSSGRKRIFATSASFTGDLKTAGAGTDGSDGADRLCAAAAKSAGLSGAWFALLSAPSADARDRVSGEGPWVLVDWTTEVFKSKEAMFSGVSPSTGLDVDEAGKKIQSPNTIQVWTGSQSNGTHWGHDCEGWTTAAASPSSLYGGTGQPTVGGAWLGGGGTGCEAKLHLYCVEK